MLSSYWFVLIVSVPVGQHFYIFPYEYRQQQICQHLTCYPHQEALTNIDSSKSANISYTIHIRKPLRIQIAANLPTSHILSTSGSPYEYRQQQIRQHLIYYPHQEALTNIDSSKSANISHAIHIRKPVTQPSMHVHDVAVESAVCYLHHESAYFIAKCPNEEYSRIGLCGHHECGMLNQNVLSNLPFIFMIETENSNRFGIKCLRIL